MESNKHPVAKSVAVITVSAVFCLAVVGTLGPPISAGAGRKSSRTHSHAKLPTENSRRSHYKVEIAVNFDSRSYTGAEDLRWVNTDDHPSSQIYFHLYSNMRVPVVRPADQQDPAAPPANPDQDEPRLEISEVRSAQGGGPLQFSLDDQETTLRVNLDDAVPAGGSTNVLIKFKGTVPEIDPEETGILAHVVQQVGAALRSERESRRARDVNFSSRGLMMLGTAFPLLAAREGGEWQRKVEPSIGDVLFSDVASYDFSVKLPADIKLFASAKEIRQKIESESVVHTFQADGLRDFAVVAGRNLRSADKMVGGIEVRSVYFTEHEIVGNRVLGQAAEAVRVFTKRFGELPLKWITVVDTPLVAGLGSVEFSGLSAVASALYVDFDSPLVRNLPELIREQRSSVEGSLEWTTAHVVAHQWWGTAVGSDPQRFPVQDEALANFSALLYYIDVRGEELAAAALNDQLRGVYKVYRTFGGEDMQADKAAHDYRNFFQYSAIVSSKGALMFAELRRQLGDEKFFDALRTYYQANLMEVAEMDDLRGAFLAEVPANDRRAVSHTFNRWLSSKRGDEDVAQPDPQLADALGINPSPIKNDRNAFSRLGKFFWQQMVRFR